MQFQIQKQKAITLIALVITIVILLILAGVSIATLAGEEGLISNVEKAKLEQMKAETKENINMAIIQIQTQEIPKGENVTLQTLHDKLPTADDRIKTKDYIEGDTELKGTYTANQHTKFNFIIDSKLNVTIKDFEQGAFPITVTDIEKTSLRVTGDVEELNKIGTTEFTYVAETSASNQIKFENITDTSYVITGLEAETEYDVYMLAYDNVGNVTKSNVETVKTKNLEIEVTTPYIGTSTTDTDSTNSVQDNSQTKGTTLYINFSATLEGTDCTITLKDDTSKTVPYEITGNETYTFVATGTYNGKTVTKEVKVAVNKYKAATGLVQYDAGEWTEKEIDELTKNSLYAINIDKTLNKIFRLDDSSGLNFTFGGFTYKEDTTNQSAINSGTVITSRNQSVTPQSGYGTPSYDGWQILESEERNGKTYVMKLVHAGSPENFVNYKTAANEGDRAEYLLSSGTRQTGYNKLSSGKSINIRSWEMYKDKELDAKGSIDNVHLMTRDEAENITGNTEATDGVRKTGGAYWLATKTTTNLRLYWCTESASMTGRGIDANIGIRPVVEMIDGVYIASGNGTEANPYVLGKD